MGRTAAAVCHRRGRATNGNRRPLLQGKPKFKLPAIVGQRRVLILRHRNQRPPNRFLRNLIQHLPVHGARAISLPAKPLRTLSLRNPGIHQTTEYSRARYSAQPRPSAYPPISDSMCTAATQSPRFYHRRSLHDVTQSHSVLDTITKGPSCPKNPSKPHFVVRRFPFGGAAQFSQPGAAKLFANAPKSLEEAFATARSSKPQAFPLPWRVRLQTVSTQTTYESPNIIGEIVGSDPALRDQYVVYTAHVDHLGICPPVDGDNVCHGSLDNASGTSALLEIARAY